jgi:hypothetical protein
MNARPVGVTFSTRYHCPRARCGTSISINIFSACWMVSHSWNGGGGYSLLCLSYGAFSQHTAMKCTLPQIVLPHSWALKKLIQLKVSAPTPRGNGTSKVLHIET